MTSRRKKAPVGGGIAAILPANLLGGQPRGVNRTLQRPQQDGQTSGVVSVFVGEEDGGNFPRIDAGQGEALEGLSRAQSHVEQDRASVRPQDRRVAAAPAAKDDKFHAADATGMAGAGQTGSAFRSWPNPRRLR
jgi:hypothetical protein